MKLSVYTPWILALCLVALGCGDEQGESTPSAEGGTEGGTIGATEGGDPVTGIGVPIESISCSSHDDCAAAIPEILECEIPRCVSGKCTLAIAEDGIACNDFIICTKNDRRYH